MLEQGKSFDESSIPNRYKTLIYETIRTDLKVQAGYLKPSDNLSNIENISITALLRARNTDMANEHRRREAEWNAKNNS